MSIIKKSTLITLVWGAGMALLYFFAPDWCHEKTALIQAQPALVNMFCLSAALCGAFFLLHRFSAPHEQALARRLIIVSWLTALSTVVPAAKPWIFAFPALSLLWLAHLLLAALMLVTEP